MSDKISEKETIHLLGKMLEEANTSTKDISTGSCVYTGGEDTYRSKLTKSQCDQLKGIWSSGG